MRKTIARTIPALYARLHFGKVLSAVAGGSRDIVVMRHGKPVAVMINLDTYLRQVSPRQRLEHLEPEVIVTGLET